MKEVNKFNFNDRFFHDLYLLGLCEERADSIQVIGSTNPIEFKYYYGFSTHLGWFRDSYEIKESIRNIFISE